jgi:hypothetical protein
MSGTGPGRAVEVLYDRGPGAGGNRWSGGSGYLVGGRFVLTAAHIMHHRQVLRDGEQLLVRTIDGCELAARVVLACEGPDEDDLALLEITAPRFDGSLPPVAFASVNRDSPAPVTDCWAVGFPRFGEADPVLPEGSKRETWHVGGAIWPGTKLRAGLLSMHVTSAPRSAPASLAGSGWEGMSGAVVFASDPRRGEHAGSLGTRRHPVGLASCANRPAWAAPGHSSSLPSA